MQIEPGQAANGRVVPHPLGYARAGGRHAPLDLLHNPKEGEAARPELPEHRPGPLLTPHRAPVSRGGCLRAVQVPVAGERDDVRKAQPLLERERVARSQDGRVVKRSGRRSSRSTRSARSM